jgi:glc operon protein GlcG
VLRRLDNTQVASVDVGIGKARAAAVSRSPGKVFEDQVRSGRVAALAAWATPLQGGIPLTFDGKVIGAIVLAAIRRRKTRTLQWREPRWRKPRSGARLGVP